MNPNHKNEVSAGFILAGLCSFIFSGLGQLLLNRIWSAIGFFFLEAVLWGVLWVNIESEIGFVFTLVLLFFTRILSAYFASNGHQIRLSSVEDDFEPLNRNKQSYEEYLEQCKVNRISPLSKADYNQS